MDHVDVSMLWGHPKKLEPQVAVSAPDGFHPQNSVVRDKQSSADLRAPRSNVVLPRTGASTVWALRRRTDQMRPFSETHLISCARFAPLAPRRTQTTSTTLGLARLH